MVSEGVEEMLRELSIADIQDIEEGDPVLRKTPDDMRQLGKEAMQF